MLKPTSETITGLILAGGRGSRFNDQDKGLIPYLGTTLIEHAITKLKPQTGSIIISANRHLDFYQRLNAKVVKDEIGGYSGPLAGIHAALKNVQTEWLVSIACDTPCFPNNYAKQLCNAINNDVTRLVVARSNQRVQSVSMLVHQSLYTSLDTFLKAGERKAQMWLEQNNVAFVDINTPAHAFYNINTPAELVELERLESK